MFRSYDIPSRTALAVILTTAALGASVTASAATDKPAMEKCYGVAAAAQNDCATASNSCAGTVKKDRAADAFIAVPEGLCHKIAGGSTKVPMDKKKS